MLEHRITCHLVHIQKVKPAREKMSKNVCAVCETQAQQTCSVCNSVYYCSKDHQKSHWKQHKSACAPYKIHTTPEMGRHLIATRNIKPGETILKKLPLVAAPKMISFPICLGCHSRLIDFYECSKCAWPLCSAICEKSDLHKAECEIFKEKKFKGRIQGGGKQSIYAVIAPVRALILKKENPKKFESLMELQSNIEENLKGHLYKMLRLTLVPLITNLNLQTSEEEILKICSIFDTNAFEVRDIDGLNIRGIYPTTSFINHNCTVNTKHIFEPRTYEIRVIATTDIPKNSTITTTYTQTLWSTLARHSHLKQVKNFECTCNRCKDPSEFGTYAGSFICESCGIGKMIREDVLKFDADWKCEDCDFLVNAADIAEMNSIFKKVIYGIDKSDPKYFEKFLEENKRVLHGTNCHVLEVKYALTQMYGTFTGYTLDVISDDLLKRKIDLCEELIAVADKLEPGLSRFRGNLLNDLQAALIEKTKRELRNGNITQTDAKKSFGNCLRILQEATEILEVEPDMGDILNRNLKKLLELI